MTPEQRAREQIDTLLADCGWIVQDYRSMNLSAGPGIAIREFPLSTGAADYALYVQEKASSVIEAKPEGHPLKGVEIQSAKYANGWPKGLPCYKMPLPFAYESTGDQTQFTNILEPDARSREVMAFHRPEELLRLVGLDRQVRDRLKGLPPIDFGRLWKVQVEAVQNLE